MMTIVEAVWLCTCCQKAAVAKACECEHREADTEPLGLISDQYYAITPGLARELHAQGCPNRTRVPMIPCDCPDETDPMYRPCGGCGSWQTGLRHVATLWLR